MPSINPFHNNNNNNNNDDDEDNNSNNNNNNNNNKNDNNNMHREIIAFLQHCVGHFCCIHKIVLSAIRLGCEVGYIPFNSTIG